MSKPKRKSAIKPTTPPHVPYEDDEAPEGIRFVSVTLTATRTVEITRDVVIAIPEDTDDDDIADLITYEATTAMMRNSDGTFRQSVAEHITDGMLAPYHSDVTFNDEGTIDNLQVDNVEDANAGDDVAAYFLNT